MAKVTKQVAASFLSNVPEEHKFWCSDGSVYSNVEDLSRGLKKMKAGTFKYHVNEQKNDFCNWVVDIVGDNTLANQIRKCSTKTSAASAVSKRVNDLKKIAK